jgi:predicted kinase
MHLVLPIGISGSGKTYLGSQLAENYMFELVCPDDIRKELCGNMSEQRLNDQVFAEAHKRIFELIDKDENCYFSATNTSSRIFDDLNKFQKYAVEVKTDYLLDVVFMMDSISIATCASRVFKDLQAGIERSKVPLDIIKRQQEYFFTQLKSIDHFYALGRNTKVFFHNSFGIDDVEDLDLDDNSVFFEMLQRKAKD